MARPILTGTALADWLHLQASATAMEVNAGAGDDGVFGGIFRDLIRGGDGNDLLWGNAGADTLLGDAGNDQAWGGEGADSLDGGAGNDLLWGDNGNDTVKGGTGDDQIWGGEGHDSLDGGAGQDMLWGGQGNDTMALGGGNDQAWGEDGDDRISTGTGNDTVYAGQGADSVDGGAGDDSIIGEAGNDTLLAGEGNNALSGGEGDDSITAGAGNDSITGDGGNDVIQAGNGRNTVWSGQGDDIVTTGTGNDTIGTDEGNDVVSSGAGNDFIYGNGGNDSLDAGAGNDFVTGDMGDDSLIGGEGNDSIYGGEGNDLILAGSGADLVSADGGNDVVVHTRGGAAGDRFNGGAGFDTLAFDLSLADWQDAGFQRELASYQAQLASGRGGSFNFASQNLKVSNFEAVSVTVDGKAPVTATEDAAVTAKADAFSVTEDAASLAGNVLLNDQVPDLLAKLEITSAATTGTLALAQDGGFTWNGGAAFQSLAAGESRDVTFAYKATDMDGDAGTAQVTITVQGANDGPAYGVGTQTGAITELADGAAGAGSTQQQASGSLAFTDLDLTDAHSVLVSGSGLGKLTAGIASDSTGGTTGAVAWSYSVNDAALDGLKAGETRVETFDLTLSDGKGGTAVQSVSVTLTGSNEGPVAMGDEGKTDEDTAITLDLLANDSDANGDALTLVSVSASEFGAGIKLEGDAVIYDPAASAKLQALGAGETATDSFTYTLRDANGAETTQTVKIAVAGLADTVAIGPKTIASFESGLDKGWQDTGDVSTVKGGTLGKMATELSTDDAKDQKEVEGWLQLDKGTLDKLGFGNADEGSAIRGKVELEAGQTLGFDWLFEAASKSGGNDFSFVTLRHDGENTVIVLADVKKVGEGHDSGWQSFSFQAKEAGTYEIGIGVMDVGSSDGHSTLLVDNVWFG